MDWIALSLSIAMLVILGLLTLWAGRNFRIAELVIKAGFLEVKLARKTKQSAPRMDGGAYTDEHALAAAERKQAQRQAVAQILLTFAILVVGLYILVSDFTPESRLVAAAWVGAVLGYWLS